MSFVERIKVTDGTEVASVDANNRLEVAEANSAAIKTAVELLDNAIAGSEMQVDVVAALPAGTNNIGDVDVLTVPAPLSTSGNGTAATALRVTMASDSTGVIAATQSGTWNINNVSGTVSLPTGAATAANQTTMITALQLLDDVVTTDGAAIGTTKLAMVGGFDGTNAQYLSTNSSGFVNIADGNSSITVDGTVAATQSGTWVLGANSGVDIGDVTINNASIAVTGTFWQATQPVSLASVPSHPVTNAGTFAVQVDGAALTSLQLLDDVVATAASAALTKLYQVGGTDGTNARVLSTNTSGHVNIADGSNSITVDAPVGTPVSVRLSDGTNHIATLPVSLASVPSHPVTNAGTFAVQAAQSGTWNITNVSGTVSLPTGASTSANQSTIITALQLLDDAIVTDDATFTVGTTKLNMAGGYVVAHGTSNPDAADAGDAGAILMNRHRIPFMLGGHPNLQSAEYITTAAQTGDNVLPLVSTGTKYVITGVTVAASAANTVNVSVRLGFGTSAVPTQGASAADAVTKVILSHPGIAPGSGISKGHAGGIVGIGGDAEELYIACSVPTGGSLVVQVDYFTIES